MNGPPGTPQVFPVLPVLGWSAFSGEKAASFPSVLDAPHRRYTLSGRAAIALALRVLGIKPGDKVLVPTYHCTTMITPIAQVQAEPLFYPITAKGSPDLRWLEAASVTGVRAMIVAHYFGLPQPMSAYREFCTAHGISLIEDCAHAFFGMFDDVPMGRWGDVAIASLRKFFPVSEGGMIVSYSHPLSRLGLTSRGWRGEAKAFVDAIEVGVMHRKFPGLNSIFLGLLEIKKRFRRSVRSENAGGRSARSDPGNEPLLSSSRPALAARWLTNHVHQRRIVTLRRRNYLHLAQRLSTVRGARIPFPDLPAATVPYVFPLYVHNPDASYQHLRAAGVPIFRWDESWPDTPVIEGDYGRDWTIHMYQIGCHQDLSLEDLDALAETIRTIIEDAR